MNIIFDTTDAVTIGFARRSGHTLADKLTVSWDAVESRLMVLATRPVLDGRSGVVYSADLSTLAVDDDDLFEFRQRFDSLLRMSVIDRVLKEGDCLLSDHYSEFGIAELVSDINKEFCELMDGPMDGLAASDDMFTANDLYNELMASIAAKTGQSWLVPSKSLAKTETDTRARLVTLIAAHLDHPYDLVTTASDWTWDDLDADSLDLIELVMAAEKEFGIEIEDEEAQATTNVTDMAALIDNLLSRPAKGDAGPSDEAVEAFKTAFHRHQGENPHGAYEDNIRVGLAAALHVQSRIADEEAAA
jgi:acyl carrier protein